MSQLSPPPPGSCAAETDVYLVSCVAGKMPGARPAKDLYISAWFQNARRRVEKTEAPWLILSAKHGVLRPDQIISPYDETLNVMPVHARRLRADKVMTQLPKLAPGPKGFIFLAGARYREFLAERLRHDGLEVEIPMKGLGIGQQLRWLSKG